MHFKKQFARFSSVLLLLPNSLIWQEASSINQPLIGFNDPCLISPRCKKCDNAIYCALLFFHVAVKEKRSSETEDHAPQQMQN